MPIAHTTDAQSTSLSSCQQLFGDPHQMNWRRREKPGLQMGWVSMWAEVKMDGSYISLLQGVGDLKESVT